MTADARPPARTGEVAILLAAYRGASWLPAQLASLEAQTEQGWSLLARDDCSGDGTLEVLGAFGRRHPGRLEILEDQDGNLGARGNFARLLERARAPYVAICDQDDVWLPDKIEVTLAAMRSLESRHGIGTPLLVHSDARVVGPDLDELAPSLWRTQGTDPGALSLARLLVQNTVTGCTTLANRALVEAARPVPPDAVLHDWWLALVAAALGRVEPVERATLLYRQHGANEVGARRHGLAAVLAWPARREALAAAMGAQVRQGAALLAHLRPRLAPAQVRLLEDFASLGEAGWLRRRWLRARHGLWYAGVARNVALALFG